MLTKFLSLNLKGTYLRLKKKDDFGVVLPYSVKWRHEVSCRRHATNMAKKFTKEHDATVKLV